MSLTVADITEIQLEYFLNNPARLAKAFMAVDEDGFNCLVQQCKERGIDPLPAIKTAFAGFEDFARRWGIE